MDVVDLKEKSLWYKARRKVVEFFPVERRETESMEVRGKIQECLLSFASFFSRSAVRCFELTDSVLKLSFPMSLGGKESLVHSKRCCKGNENRLLRLDASLIVLM